MKMNRKVVRSVICVLLALIFVISLMTALIPTNASAASQSEINQLTQQRKELQAKLKAAGIPSMVYYAKPMHLQGAFAGTDSANADCPVTEKLCATVLSLPLDPYKSKDDVDLVVSELKKVIL